MTDEETADIIRWYLKKKHLLSKSVKSAMLTAIYRNEIYRDTLQNIETCRFSDPVKTIHMIKILAHQALDCNSLEA